jgi:hypothetical protein
MAGKRRRELQTQLRSELSLCGNIVVRFAAYGKRAEAAQTASLMPCSQRSI